MDATVVSRGIIPAEYRRQLELLIHDGEQGGGMDDSSSSSSSFSPPSSSSASSSSSSSSSLVPAAEHGHGEHGEHASTREDLLAHGPIASFDGQLDLSARPPEHFFTNLGALLVRNNLALRINVFGPTATTFFALPTGDIGSQLSALWPRGSTSPNRTEITERRRGRVRVTLDLVPFPTRRRGQLDALADDQGDQMAIVAAPLLMLLFAPSDGDTP